MTKDQLKAFNKIKKTRDSLRDKNNKLAVKLQYAKIDLSGEVRAGIESKKLRKLSKKVDELTLDFKVNSSKLETANNAIINFKTV